jgi:UDP-glucose 4-epimerase
MVDVEKKVLVTGGAGFIGSRLVQALLKRECRVKVLDSRCGVFEGKKNPNLEFVGVGSDGLRGGMADRSIVEQAVEDVDVVYHLAINWDGYTWKHTLPLADLFDVNVRGTLNLLEAAKSEGVRHFLFSSSCAVYGESGSMVVDEECVCNPELWVGDVGPAYGVLKLAVEKLCLLYCRQYGLPVTVFRIEFVFDESEALPSSKIMENVRKGETIEVVEGDGYASIHVDDVVEAFLLATLNENAFGQVFNLSNPAAYVSYRELYEFLVELTGSKSVVKLVTDPLYRGRVPESVEKIERVLGWKPLRGKDDLKRALVSSIKSR